MKTKTANHEPTKEKMDTSDFVVGFIYMLISLGILIALGVYYWNIHGGSLENFSFWEDERKKWLEVVFWAFFASIAQNIGYGMYKMGEGILQKRNILLLFARNIEAPFISLALIFVLFNLGVAFGDATITLKDVPVTVMIAFTIVTSFFSWQTKASLEVVSVWFTKQLKKSLGIEDKELKSP
ncbi:MAG: hypothetical protein KF758_01615 [Anaerolineales bacterium]|nr:hypothetical protein [Anaerolineales bacterium]MBX3035584.1 hypothetical protein [Anaerolineales bacterium]